MPPLEAVDLHEKSQNFLTEAEVERFLQAAKSGRQGIRDHAMMLLMYRHGLRETELCRLTIAALDLETTWVWIDRLKASLSTHHPIAGGSALPAASRFPLTLVIRHRARWSVHTPGRLPPGPRYRQAHRSG